MSRPPEPRWSYTELDAWLVNEGYTLRWQKCSALGIPERTLFRWRRHGVPDRSADAAAIRLGTHPALVWAGWSELASEC